MEIATFDSSQQHNVKNNVQSEKTSFPTLLALNFHQFCIVANNPKSPRKPYLETTSSQVHKIYKIVRFVGGKIFCTFALIVGL